MGGNDVPLRELVKQQTELINKHIADSNAYRETTITTLTAIQIHNEYAKEKINEHDDDIKKLKSSHYWAKGVIWICSLLGLGTIASKYLLK